MTHDRRPSIAFLGLFGGGNLGNEASLQAAIEAVRRIDPGLSLSCICHVPDAVEREHGIPAHSLYMAGGVGSRSAGRSRWQRLLLRPFVELSRWVVGFRFLRDVDLVVVPGTGILDDFGMRPWQMPSDLFRWSMLTRLSRTSLAYVAVGAGPITDRANRWLLRAAVGRADQCSYRDEGSLAFMRSIGRDTRDDRVVPDLAFALDPPPESSDTDRPQTVGVGVMAYWGWRNSPTAGADVYARYVETIRALGAGLLAEGCSVRLLIGEVTDVAVVEELLPELRAVVAGAPERVETGTVDTMDDLLREMALTDVVFATRYHNVVGALIAGRPVVSAGYAEKNRWLLDDVGLETHCQSVDSIDVDRAIESLRALLADRDQHAARIRDQVATWRGGVRAEFEHVISSTLRRCGWAKP